MKTITFDIMLGGRFVCTMRMPFCPLFPLTTEEIQSFIHKTDDIIDTIKVSWEE